MAASEEVSGEVGGGARGGAPATTPIRSDTIPSRPEAELMSNYPIILFLYILNVLCSMKFVKKTVKITKKN